MRHLLPHLLLLPVACAAEPAWLAPAVEQAQAEIQHWEQEAQGVAAEFTSYELATPGAATAADSAMPETAADETAVCCDGALLFDIENSSLVYVANVRLSDPRLQLRALHRLFIRLEKGQMQQREKDARDTAKQARDSFSAGDAVPVEKVRRSRPDDLPGDMQRPLVVTEDAVVDTESNSIILSSPAGGRVLTAQSGENTLELTTAPDKPARVFVDAVGNVLMTGAEVRITRRDAQGRLTRLLSRGSVYFSAAENTLVLTGGGHVEAPEGDIRFNRTLTARLRIARPSTPHPGFMQQFADLNYQGIAEVHAEGQVAADWREGQQPVHLDGEELDYNADTGLCTVQGEDCTVGYGANRLVGAQRIELRPDGTVVLNGRELGGDYERPALRGLPAQKGHFRSGGEITYTNAGDHGVILLPEGLSMADEGGDLSCAGPVELHLRPADKPAKVPQLADSKVNLALARYGQLAYAKAAGPISGHLYGADHSLMGELSAAAAEVDFVGGSVSLLGSETVPAIAAYENNRLEATAGKGELPRLTLSANGDIELRGGDINASFSTGDGASTARCRKALRLLSADRRLETESAAEFRSAQGILTTNGPLRAKLSVREGTIAPLTKLLPTFTFPYNGILEIATEQGGTVQTAKGSLQCSGPVRVTMAPAPGAEYGGLETAEANGHVVVAGKDKDGRMMRATGDHLSVDMQTGDKLLSGGTVTLSDAYNTHSASGGGAAVRIDRQNNARISGAVQKTTVRRISEQIEQQKQKKEKQ